MGRAEGLGFTAAKRLGVDAAVVELRAPVAAGSRLMSWPGAIILVSTGSSITPAAIARRSRRIFASNSLPSWGRSDALRRVQATTRASRNGGILRAGALGRLAKAAEGAGMSSFTCE